MSHNDQRHDRFGIAFPPFLRFHGRLLADSTAATLADAFVDAAAEALDGTQEIAIYRVRWSDLCDAYVCHGGALATITTDDDLSLFKD